MQVPLDGVVVHGTAQVSWSHISGEALPVQLQQGDQVPAGTLNHDGLLVVQASKGFQDSTPARIARLTAQAQASLLYPIQSIPGVCWLHQGSVRLAMVGMPWDGTQLCVCQPQRASVIPV